MSEENPEQPETRPETEEAAEDAGHLAADAEPVAGSLPRDAAGGTTPAEAAQSPPFRATYPGDAVLNALAADPRRSVPTDISTVGRASVVLENLREIDAGEAPDGVGGTDSTEVDQRRPFRASYPGDAIRSALAADPRRSVPMDISTVGRASLVLENLRGIAAGEMNRTGSGERSEASSFHTASGSMIGSQKELEVQQAKAYLLKTSTKSNQNL